MSGETDGPRPDLLENAADHHRQWNTVLQQGISDTVAVLDTACGDQSRAWVTLNTELRAMNLDQVRSLLAAALVRLGADVRARIR